MKKAEILVVERLTTHRALFSTAMVETVRLVQAGEYRRAVANALGSLLLAVGAAALGIAVMWAVARSR